MDSKSTAGAGSEQEWPARYVRKLTKKSGRRCTQHLGANEVLKA